jgi:DNA polymerase-3 subunit beta
MKIKVHKNLLHTATQRLIGVLLDKNLGQIGLRTHEGKLVIAAMDRILAVYNDINCEILNEGVVFVSGKLFTDVVKELPEGNVNITTENNFLLIEAGANNEYKMKLPIIEGASWKEPSFVFSKNCSPVNASKLAYMIDQVQHCVQHESARNYGTVGYLHRSEKGKLRLVGTDGFRLSFCEIEGEFSEGFLEEGICLSKRALNELAKMANEGFENVQLAISDDQTTIMASVENYKLFSRLSTVKYPKYQGVLPTANLHPIELTKNLIQAMTKRVMLAADKTNALQLSFADNSLTLSSKTLGSSESSESLNLKDFKGARTEFSVNGKFLNEVFSHTSADAVTIQFKNEEHPFVIIPRDEPKNCHSMHVLVPIRETVR